MIYELQKDKTRTDRREDRSYKGAKEPTHRMEAEGFQGGQRGTQATVDGSLEGRSRGRKLGFSVGGKERPASRVRRTFRVGATEEGLPMDTGERTPPWEARGGDVIKGTANLF